MRIKLIDDLLVIYLYNVKLDLINNLILIKDIKKVLERIINYYQYDLAGMYNVVIFENDDYGYILELKKIKDFEYGNYLDLKLNIKYKQSFYMVCDNYNYLSDLSNIWYKDGYYYVNIKEIKDKTRIFEYGDILYKDMDFLQCKSVNLINKIVN